METYRSQTTYPHGGTMCTSASLMFSCAALLNSNLDLPPTQEQMECIMDISSKCHSRIPAMHLNHGLVAIDHLVDTIGIPSNFSHIHVMGNVSMLAPEVPTSFTATDGSEHCICTLQRCVQLLQPGMALLYTCRNHTKCIVVDGIRRCWLFDPFPAYVKCLGLPRQAADFVMETDRGDFQGLVLTKNPRN